MKLQYTQKELTKFKIEIFWQSFLGITAVVLGTLYGLSFLNYIVIGIYVVGIFGHSLVSYLLNTKKEFIEQWPKEPKVLKNVIFNLKTDSWYYYLATVIEMSVFLSLGLQLLFVLSWVSLGAQMLLKSTYHKIYSIQ